MLRSLSRSIQFEDIVLFLWLVALEPLAAQRVTAWEGGGAWGWLLLAAVLSGLVVMLTRSPGEGEGGWAFVTAPPLYARLPMMAGMGLLAAMGFERLGRAAWGDSAFAGILGAFGLSFIAYAHLPTLPALARRLFATPLVVIGGAQFRDIAAQMMGDLDLQTFMEGLRTPGVSFIVTLLTVALLVQYAMFVFGPRQVADGHGTWPQWLLRFLLYLTGLLSGRALWPL